MRIVKQRLTEMVPDLSVFLDVENLVSGSGVRELDHTSCVLVFGMSVYFQKQNCVKELFRAVLRNKPIILLLPDIEVHGVFTPAMITEIVTDEWMKKWKRD